MTIGKLLIWGLVFLYLSAVFGSIIAGLFFESGLLLAVGVVLLILTLAG